MTVQPVESSKDEDGNFARILNFTMKRNWTNGELDRWALLQLSKHSFEHKDQVLLDPFLLVGLKSLIKQPVSIFIFMKNLKDAHGSALVSDLLLLEWDHGDP